MSLSPKSRIRSLSERLANLQRHAATELEKAVWIEPGRYESIWSVHLGDETPFRILMKGSIAKVRRTVLQKLQKAGWNPGDPVADAVKLFKSV